MKHFMRRLSLLVFISLAAFSANRESVCAEPKDQHIAAVNIGDIPDKVQIVGRLGEPLGALLKVRGKWIPAGLRKDPLPLFHFEQVDGKPLPGNVQFHRGQMTPIDPNGRKTDLWDWRFGGGTEAAPEPVEGENWEMLGVETAVFTWYSKAAMEEASDVPVAQAPSYMAGFYSVFEIIAIKKVGASEPASQPAADPDRRDQLKVPAKAP